VKIGRVLHRKLHRVFDRQFKEFARNEGWRKIYNLLGNEKIATPAKLFDAMEAVTRQVLGKHKTLDDALGEIKRIRELLKIPPA
jgi:oligoendopeptidase F